MSIIPSSTDDLSQVKQEYVASNLPRIFTEQWGQSLKSVRKNIQNILDFSHKALNQSQVNTTIEGKDLNQLEWAGFLNVKDDTQIEIVKSDSKIIISTGKRGIECKKNSDKIDDPIITMTAIERDYIRKLSLESSDAGLIKKIVDLRIDIINNNDKNPTKVSGLSYLYKVGYIPYGYGETIDSNRKRKESQIGPPDNSLELFLSESQTA